MVALTSFFSSSCALRQLSEQEGAVGKLVTTDSSINTKGNGKRRQGVISKLPVHAPLPTLTAEAAEQANKAKFHLLGPLRFHTLFVEAPSLQLSLDLLDSKLDGISLMKHIMFLRVHELKW